MHALYMRLGKERSFLYFCPYKNPSFLRTYIFMLLNTTFMHKFSKKKEEKNAYDKRLVFYRRTGQPTFPCLNNIIKQERYKEEEGYLEC